MIWCWGHVSDSTQLNSQISLFWLCQLQVLTKSNSDPTYEMLLILVYSLSDTTNIINISQDFIDFGHSSFIGKHLFSYTWYICTSTFWSWIYWISWCTTISTSTLAHYYTYLHWYYIDLVFGSSFRIKSTWMSKVNIWISSTLCTSNIKYINHMCLVIITSIVLIRYKCYYQDLVWFQCFWSLEFIGKHLFRYNWFMCTSTFWSCI